MIKDDLSFKQFQFTHFLLYFSYFQVTKINFKLHFLLDLEQNQIQPKYIYNYAIYQKSFLGKINDNTHLFYVILVFDFNAF